MRGLVREGESQGGPETTGRGARGGAGVITPGQVGRGGLPLLSPVLETLLQPAEGSLGRMEPAPGRTQGPDGLSHLVLPQGSGSARPCPLCRSQRRPFLSYTQSFPVSAIGWGAKEFGCSVLASLPPESRDPPKPGSHGTPRCRGGSPARHHLSAGHFPLQAAQRGDQLKEGRPARFGPAEPSCRPGGPWERPGPASRASPSCFLSGALQPGSQRGAVGGVGLAGWGQEPSVPVLICSDLARARLLHPSWDPHQSGPPCRSPLPPPAAFRISPLQDLCSVPWVPLPH